MRDKESQKPLDHVRQSAKDALKTTSKRLIQKTAEKIAGTISNSKKTRKNCWQNWKFSIISPQNNSKTVKNEHDKEIPKERYISPEET